MGAIGLIGLEEPGLWIVGAGLELAYLLMLAGNGRFQRFVDGKKILAGKQTSQQQLAGLLAKLMPADQARYGQLAKRCQMILQQQQESRSPDVQIQADGLNKLLFVYLRLMITRAGIVRVLEDGDTPSEHRYESQRCEPAIEGGRRHRSCSGA